MRGLRRGGWVLVPVLALMGLLLGIATAPTAAPAAPAGPLPTAPADPGAVTRVQALGATLAGHRLAGAQVLATAARSPKVVEALRQYPKAKPEVFLKGPEDWQVSWFTPGTGEARKEVAQVKVADASGKIIEAYNGPQVAWTMARGYSGAFGRKVNSPWVWIPLSVLFIAPFCSLRRRGGWVHILQLDLLALVGFGVSVAYFNDANIDASVPIATGLLLYVLLRMLWIGYRRTPQDGAAPTRDLPLWVSPVWLAVALIFLVGFRIGLNVNASNVIDVGYSGVIGADRLVDGTSIYGHFPKDNEHGDTYGPVAYEAYVPFEQALAWSGKWDDLPAAHAAAIAFDLLTLFFLFLAGRRIRGPGLGIVLAYLWAAWPFSLYVLNCNSNDGLVAAFAAATLYVAAKPGPRGAVAALAGLTKLGALGLAPLLATHGAPRGKSVPPARAVAKFTAAFVATAVVVSLPIILRGESLHTIYDRTIAFQANRNAPFSIWGLYGWTVGEHMWQLTAAFFAAVAAFLPRRRDIVGLAAVAAAVVIGLQLGLNYWFYLYLVWFFPFLAVALFARYRVPDPA